jgi:predicted phosphodiesterase
MRSPEQGLTRRSFLATTSLGVPAAALGFPAFLSWFRPGARAGRLRIVLYSDVHARTEWETPRALRTAADAMNAQKPDLLVGCGDHVTEGFRSSAATMAPRWDVYVEHLYDRLEAPALPVIGNHDLTAARPRDGTPRAEDPRVVFRERFGVPRTYRTFEHRGYRFIFVDSIGLEPGAPTYQGWVDGEQKEWIRSVLSTVSEDTPVVLATHVPFHTAFYQFTLGTTKPPPRSRVIVNARDVLKLFENHNLVLVLQGHTHVDEIVRWRNITYITGGAVSGRWWRGHWYGTREGFGIVTLDGNRVDWEYVHYGWTARRPEGA